jgi:hypothetical protein
MPATRGRRRNLLSPTQPPTCAPERVAYNTAQDGLIAWLNRAVAGLCSARTLHVMLPAGTVRLGDELLGLPPGLRLILHGLGRSGASTTTLDLERRLPVELNATNVRIDFTQINIVNVR